MDISTTTTLVISAFVGILLNFLVGAIKNLIDRSKTRDIILRTKEGRIINIHVNKNMSVEEVDSKVKNAIEDSTPSEKEV
jgi:hypothetical protein